jgi:Tol biopolymer transport system component
MLPPGARIGPHEILSLLGAGGMGHVYRVRDTRLDREIALKVLHREVGADPVRLERFEREARSASALNHPNIITIYDVGTSDSVAWIAMEKVDGRTLRQVLSSVALPIKTILPIAAQLADGLAKAHEIGIVHRDLKPENVMVAKDGQVKILDFGLAKLAPTGPVREGVTPETETFPGTVLGTVGYMSPEQAAGQPVDFRSDQFSLGSILYEMATGARAFRKKTSVETLTAILNEEPTPVGQLNPETPAPLRWIVDRCLAKEPDRRYASTRDLARDLETLRERSSESAGLAVAARYPRRATPLRLAATGVVLLAAGLLAGKLLWKEAAKPPPTFRRLTFRRGLVISARFAPDGQNVVYSAKWGDEPQRVFLSHIGSPESLSLPLPDYTMLLGVSRAGELALSLRAPPMFSSPDPLGTLGTVPLAGRSPREMLEHVQSADWPPRGEGLAVAHEGRLEFPIGKVLYQEGAVGGARISPKGDRIAILEIRDGQASVSVVDLSGKRTELARLGSALDTSNAASMAAHTGFAWSPDGEEIWYDQGTGATQGRFNSIMAVNLAGRSRVLLRSTGHHVVLDVSRDGRLLLSIGDVRSPVLYARAGEPIERDLGWLSMPEVAAVSADGKAVLMNEYGPGGDGAAFLRKTDGSPAFKVTDAAADALSPDGSWVGSLHDGRAMLIPTGAGDTKTLSRPDFMYEGLSWFPDGRRLLVLGREKGRDARLYLQDPSGGPLTPLSTEGIKGNCPISPDGTLVVADQPDGFWVYSVAGGERRPLSGLSKDEFVASWSQDGRSVFATVDERLPFRIYRVDVATGRRQLWKTIPLADPAGVCSADIALLPDGSYITSVARWINDLYLVEGLK